MAAPSYPATFAFDSPERVANWRPLVHWLLVIPHLVVLWVLSLVSGVVAIVSWFAILFTGRLPDGLAGVQAMALRYQTRVTTYMLFMREDYPPFGFETTTADPGDDPRVTVVYDAELDGRNRVTTFFRLILVIPQAVVLGFVGIAVAVVIFVAWFAVLFTGRWPEGLLGFVLGFERWSVRVRAYAYMLTDEYPPFTLE